MTRFRVRLNSDKQDQILSAIRAGGYPHIAALAWGVPAKLFARWLEMGRQPRAREPYRSFALAVDEAHAQARLRAEMDVFAKDSKFWLEHGPGRPTAADPGWGRPSKPPEIEAKKSAGLDPEVVKQLWPLVESVTGKRLELVKALEDKGLVAPALKSRGATPPAAASAPPAAGPAPPAAAPTPPPGNDAARAPPSEPPLAA